MENGLCLVNVGPLAYSTKSDFDLLVLWLDLYVMQSIL